MFNIGKGIKISKSGRCRHMTRKEMIRLLYNLSKIQFMRLKRKTPNCILNTFK